MLRHFATCPRGVEPWLAAEASELELPDPQIARGGVAFGGSREDAMRACLWLRCAARVLEVLDEGPAYNEDGLYRRVQRIDWSRWLNNDTTFRVDATVSSSRIRHSQYVALKAKDAIVDRLRDARGRRPSVSLDEPDVRVRLRLNKDRLTICLDLSGEPLHKRSGRVDAGIAPIRESLAAALVRASGWRGERAFYDPFCGGGTIGIEAASLALDRAPGLYRQFGFERLPGHQVGIWQTMRREALARERTSLDVPIILSDIGRRPIERAERAIAAAKVTDAIELRRADARRFALDAGPGVVLTNPPYGERLGNDEEVRALYKAFGDHLKAAAEGCDVWFFTRADLIGGIGLRPSRRHPFFNGDLDCRLAWIPIYSGRAPGRE